MKSHGLKQSFAQGAVVLALILPAMANAGRNCDTTAPDAAKTQNAIRFAKQVKETLELSGANLAMVGRIGSDQSARGVRYTHVGYVMREHPAGPWTVVHELNQCGTGTSELFDEGLANFYMDDLFDFETRIVIPSPEVQAKVAHSLLGPAKRELHEPVYSSIANPWSARFQNSNGWALEVLALSISDGATAVNREHAQSWLRNHGYVPTRIHIGGGERAGARLFTPNIRFGDHPDTAWQTQTYEVHTADSALEFLRRIDPASREITQRLDGKPQLVAARPEVKRPPEAVRATVESKAPVNEAVASPIPAALPVATASGGAGSRAQLLQSMQGLIVSYACRPQGYLNQCRQLERSQCEKLTSDAVVRCFATVSDQALMNGDEQAAMQQMKEIGYCAVEGVDAGLAIGNKSARTAQGIACPGVRDYRAAQ